MEASTAIAPTGEAAPAAAEPVPNAWCVILGTPGVNPLTIVGPFADQNAAVAHVASHTSENPHIAAEADVLVAPANC